MVHSVVAHYAKVRFSKVHSVVAVNNSVFRGAVLTVVATAEAHLDSDLDGHNLAFQNVADARKYAVEVRRFDVADAHKCVVAAHHFAAADAHKYAVEAQYFEVAAAHHSDVVGVRKCAVEASRLFLADGHKYVLAGQSVALHQCVEVHRSDSDAHTCVLGGHC